MRKHVTGFLQNNNRDINVHINTLSEFGLHLKTTVNTQYETHYCKLPLLQFPDETYLLLVNIIFTDPGFLLLAVSV